MAYIHQHFSTKQGATGTRSYEMSQRLIARGHRVTMICGVNDLTASCFALRGRISEMNIDGIHVTCIAEPYANRMGPARRAIAFMRFAQTARRVVCGLDVDLVFATSTPLSVGIPGMKAARRLNVPFVFEVRDLWPETVLALWKPPLPGIAWYLHRMERRIYAAADWIIALAPGIAKGVCRFGFPPARVTMIPNGSDNDLFKPSDEPLDDPRFGDKGDFRLVFTGAHGLANGLDAVLNAAAVLKRRGVKGVRFVFIGQGGQKERLVQRSRDEGLDNLVAWVHSIPKEELARVLPRMNVGLMILQNLEGFYYGTSPNKFFDYIASGLPVLNNYPGWLADMLKEHRAGLAVPPDDPEAFADAVVWFMEHRDEAKAMGRRGRALAEAQFDRGLLADRFADTLEHVYRTCKRNMRPRAVAAV